MATSIFFDKTLANGDIIIASGLSRDRMLEV
jgi:hypothetical protein